MSLKLGEWSGLEIQIGESSEITQGEYTEFRGCSIESKKTWYGEYEDQIHAES